MKLLVILAISLTAILAEEQAESNDSNYYRYAGPMAPIGEDGTVIDTEDVERAKSAHFAAHAAAMARLRELGNNALHETDYSSPTNYVMNYYSGKIAPLSYDGRVVETPEVARAKAFHLQAHARAASKVLSNNYEYYNDNGARNVLYVPSYRYEYTNPDYIYRGPAAPIGPDGRVIETPEVARAREAHLMAYARAASLVTESPYDRQYESGNDQQ